MEQAFRCDMCRQEFPFAERCRDEEIFARGWIICAHCAPDLRQRLIQERQQFQAPPAHIQEQLSSHRSTRSVAVKTQRLAPSLVRQRESRLQQKEKNWTFPHIAGSDYQPDRKSRGLIDTFTASYIRWQSRAHVLAWLSSFDHPHALQPVFLDTETTGTQRYSEIIEISIVGEQRQTLFHSLINPTTEIEPMASAVHGLTRQHVKDAPRYPEIHEEVMYHLHNHVVIAYLASFDIRLLKQTADSYELPFSRLHTGCLLYAYAKYREVYVERSNGQGRWKVHRLEEAMRDEHLNIPPLHRAERDAQCICCLFQSMKAQSLSTEEEL